MYRITPVIKTYGSDALVVARADLQDSGVGGDGVGSEEVRQERGAIDVREVRLRRSVRVRAAHRGRVLVGAPDAGGARRLALALALRLCGRLGRRRRVREHYLLERSEHSARMELWGKEKATLVLSYECNCTAILNNLCSKWRIQ